MNWDKILKKFGFKWSIRHVFYRLDWRVASKKDVKEFLRHNIDIGFAMQQANQLPKFKSKTNDELVMKIFQWVVDNIEYATDMQKFGLKEKWEDIDEILSNWYNVTPIGQYVKTDPDKSKNAVRIGDCFTGDTKIIVYDSDIKGYDFVRIDSLDLNKHLALSYNENKQKVEFKRILNIVNKGKKDIVKVKVNRGGEIRCTEDHRFANVINYGSSKCKGKLRYIPISEFDLNYNTTNNIPCIMKLPELHNDMSLNQNYLKLQGMYVADGYKRRDNSHSFDIAGDTPKFITDLKEVLDSLGYTYSFNDRPQNKYFSIDEDIPDWGRVSYEKHFDDNITSLNIDDIKTLLKSYIERDGNIVGKNKDSLNRNWDVEDQVILATVSDKLAEQLKILSLILGKPTSHNIDNYNYDYANRRPIHRLRQLKINKKVNDWLFCKSINSIEEDGEDCVYDIEVEDNHNFFLAESGCLVHNCESMSLLLFTLARINGINPLQIKLVAGTVPQGGHSWIEYSPDELYDYDAQEPTWIIFDPAYDPNNTLSYNTRLTFDEDDRYLTKWFEVTDI